MLVLLTREEGHNDTLRDRLPARATVVEVPLTATRWRRAESVARELRADPSYGAYHHLVVTSARAVSYLPVLRTAAPAARLASVGPATTAALVAAGEVVNVESTGAAADLADVITRGPVLIAGAADGRPELAARLRARGFVVTSLGCYATEPIEVDAESAHLLARADVVLIGAPSAWAVARDHVAPSTWVVVPGATTAAAVAADHPRVIEGWGPDLAERLDDLDLS